MRKVRLEPESLSVDSFPVSSADAERGTVQARGTDAAHTCCTYCGTCLPGPCTTRVLASDETF
jgi:hypothetical protein